MNDAPDSDVLGAGAESPVDHAWLVLYQQGRAPRTVDLVGELTIGRLLDTTGAADVAGHLSVAGDPAVSRLHAVLSRKAPGWCVQSAASSNGLFVNGRRLAVYRDDHGVLSAVSPVCTHLGCHVHFNAAERSWDCHCHGSRFDVDGSVLHGPAARALARKTIEEVPLTPQPVRVEEEAVIDIDDPSFSKA